MASAMAAAHMGEAPCRAPPEPAARLTSLFRFEGAACAPVLCPPSTDLVVAGSGRAATPLDVHPARRLSGACGCVPMHITADRAPRARGAGALRIARPLRTAE